MSATHRQRAVARASRILRAQARAAEEAALTGSEIDARMVAAIRDAIAKRGYVERRDLLAAGVPHLAINTRFRACLERARQVDPALDRVGCEP